jgi:ribosomal protein L37AE/L43A
MTDEDEQKFRVRPEVNERHDCMSCGSHLATAWSTPEGKAWLCRECATLHGLGCP